MSGTSVTRAAARSVALHAVLLVGAAAAAWTTLAEDEQAAESRYDTPEIVLVDAAPGDVSEVRYVTADGKRELVVTAREDAHGRWFEAVETTQPATPLELERADGEEGEKPATPPRAVAETKVAQGGHAARVVWERVEPLKAVRVVSDGLSAEKLAELGLDAPEATLTVTVRGKPQAFELGGVAFGSQDRYAKDVSGRVVVLPTALVRDLGIGLRRFVMRQVMTAKRPEIERLDVSVPGGAEGAPVSVSLHHRDRGDVHTAWWSLSPSAAERTEPPSTWVGSLFELRTDRFDPEVREPAATWRQALVVRAMPESGEPETLTVWQSTDDPPTWWGTGDHLRLPAKLLAAPARDLVTQAGRLAE